MQPRDPTASRGLPRFVALAIILAACGGEGPGSRDDASVPLDASVDAETSVDADVPDERDADVELDASEDGAALEDASMDDASLEDASMPDASMPDASEPDASIDDAGTTPMDGGAIAALEPGESQAGGSVTTYDFGASAYDQPLAGLSGAARSSYVAGKQLFVMDWNVAVGIADRDGLGPTFNAVSCQACHLSNGRGAPPASGAALTTALLRVSVPGVAANGGPLAHPIYGDQIEPLAIGGVPKEGTVSWTLTLEPGTYDDGSPYELARPSVVFAPSLGDPGPTLLTSMRLASQTYGLGLLEAIPESALLAHADPDDLDGDGISGRPNYVWDVLAGAATFGRFGWKANQPTLIQQSAGAFLGDVGITSPLFPTENCPAPQTACLAAPNGGTPEINEVRLAALHDFMRGTSVPARRNAGDVEVLRGKWIFRELGCASCHLPSFTTGVVADFPLLSSQTIWPYTDLLLHDLGPELADGRPDFEASGSEWRTPPLWGLGLLQVTGGHARMLHDGRARGFAEAILWHGGEAQASADGFRALSATERARLLAFLESL